SDILMPNMDGYRLCYEVRKSERFHTIPFIIFTSSYDSTSDEQLALRFGVDRFLRRPAPAAQILRAIREVLAEGSRQAVSLQPPDEAAVMKAYSEQLVRKLEERNTELERTYAKIMEVNRTLQKRTRELEASEQKFRSIF